MGVLAVLGVLFVAFAGLWTGQRRLIYFPDRTTPDLGVVGSGWEEVAYETEDGETLQAWYRPPRPGRSTVIVFNGNAGSRADRVLLGRGLAGEGLGVLLTDYRGYGGNPGEPTEDGLAADARAALGFARQRGGGSHLVYFGESLGAAVAIGLAVAEPPAVLVLRSPFASLADIGRVHYPWLPVAGLLRDRYPSLDRLEAVNRPTLVIAGDADRIVPPEQSRAIFDAAPGLKQLLIVPGADHNDLALVAGDEMIETVVRFIEEFADS